MIDWPEDFRDEGKCRAKVYIRDTYRYTGRGKSRFEMHYTERQCRRTSSVDGYCKQHAAIACSRDQQRQYHRSES